ncbi:MAG: hypothetical protein ACRC6R_04145 [Bacteroidales bacterium]
MADNYLEKQYQDYEARRAAWEREKKYGLPKTAVKKPAAKVPTEEKKETQ